jgi:hypothetical protein
MVVPGGERAHADLMESAGYLWNPKSGSWENDALGRTISGEAAAVRSVEEMCRWVETGHFRRTYY